MSTTISNVLTKSSSLNSIISSVYFNLDQQCPIQHVTVYNDRAEVTRLLRCHFDIEGTYDLLLEGFSPFVDSTSIHVKGGTNNIYTILEVSYQAYFDNKTLLTYVTPSEQLKNDLHQIELDINIYQRELARLDKQRTWLDGRALKLMNQDEPVTDLDTIQEFINFYNNALLKMDDRKAYIENEIKRLTQQRDKLEEKASELSVDNLGTTHRNERRELTIKIFVERNNIDVNLQISYLISNCSWSANYDFRVNHSEKVKHTTRLTYYGVVVNRSQEDWSNVQLSLSASTPSLDGVPPKLPTLKVNFYRPCHRYYELGEVDDKRDDSCSTSEQILSDGQSNRQTRKPKIYITSQEQSSCDSNKILVEDEQEPPNIVNFTSTIVESSILSANFTIPQRSIIKGDGEPHRVIIDILDLSSTLIYTIVPKLSIYAYLKASTINTSDKLFLAGPVSVFMDNNFITHCSIDNIGPGNKFEVPLGTDTSIKIDYKPAKKITDMQGLISKTYFENIRREIYLFNTQPTEVIVYVYEQVPVSLDERIKVKLIVPDLRMREPTGSYSVIMNDANNLQWRCILQALSECRLPIEYTLEWPTDKSIEFKED